MHLVRIFLCWQIYIRQCCIWMQSKVFVAFVAFSCISECTSNFDKCLWGWLSHSKFEISFTFYLKIHFFIQRFVSISHLSFLGIILHLNLEPKHTPISKFISSFGAAENPLILTVVCTSDGKWIHLFFSSGWPWLFFFLLRPPESVLYRNFVPRRGLDSTSGPKFFPKYTPVAFYNTCFNHVLQRPQLSYIKITESLNFVRTCPRTRALDDILSFLTKNTFLQSNFAMFLEYIMVLL